MYLCSCTCRRQRSDGLGSNLLIDASSDKAGQETVLDEIFQFIGAKPEEAVSTEYMYTVISLKYF